MAMSSSQLITAVYEDGVLKPTEALPLHNHQQVQVIVLFEAPAEAVNAERVRQLHEQADAWLARQSIQAVREPLLPQEDREQLDAELDQLLAEIRTQSDHDSEEVVADQVDAAVRAVRAANE